MGKWVNVKQKPFRRRHIPAYSDIFRHPGIIRHTQAYSEIIQAYSE